MRRHDLCDNYLEIVKDRLYNAEVRGENARCAAQFAFYNTVQAVLKMVAPIMPFVTEDRYHDIYANWNGGGSIHHSSWPVFDKTLIDGKAEKAGGLAVSILGAVRKHKNSKSLSLKTEVKLLTIDVEDLELLKPALDDIKAACQAQEVFFGKGDIECEGTSAKITVEL